ncbi:MAG: 16S rRNA (cytidine(1402)-2'-O)-methyltransferase [Rickettsiales bacterium]|jgi:16S rRNA (cytidine1402-2'-O)-methyltransferase|nr:16S rRNA (cytidine(1402)-2'-O)-methyltransferase [Rickettsiales bacterium]
MQQFFNGFKSETLEPALYVVATPIGNMGDITLRGLGILRSIEIIFCEDTRVTGRLLSVYKISGKKLFVYNDYSDEKTRKNILDLIRGGNPVALASDAGTPLISDPGFKLVKFLRENGARVIPIGGISAATAAISVAGISCDKFKFFGFLASKTREKTEELGEILRENCSVICYETAQRLLETLKIIAALDARRTICVARELTKKFEHIVVAPAGDVYNRYLSRPGELRGEVAVIIEKNSSVKNLDLNNLQYILRESLKYMSPKDAAEFVSKILGKNKKEIYKILLTMEK